MIKIIKNMKRSLNNLDNVPEVCYFITRIINLKLENVRLKCAAILTLNHSVTITGGLNQLY